LRCPICDSPNPDGSTACAGCGAGLTRWKAAFTPSAAVLAVVWPRLRPAWVLGGCGGMAAALLLLLGTCVFFAEPALVAGEKEFAPAVERYLARVQAHDYRGAYADFGKAMREAFPEQDFVSLDASRQAHLGPLRSKVRTFVQSGVDREGPWGIIVYRGIFERGEATVSITLRREGRSWRIVSILYDSPTLLGDLSPGPPGTA